MKNLNISFFCFIFLLQSCKKEKQDHLELIKTKESTTKTIYKEGKLISSEIYNDRGQLDSKYVYDNGVVIKIYQYYPDKKVNSYSYLNKTPNHYTTKVYYKNGKVSNEGEGDFFKNNSLYLRRGPWIFYSKTSKAYAIYTFTHDNNKSYIKGEMIFDTIKKKTIKDVVYDPPVLYNKEVTETVKLNNTQ